MSNISIKLISIYNLYVFLLQFLFNFLADFIKGLVSVFVSGCFVSRVSGTFEKYFYEKYLTKSWDMATSYGRAGLLLSANYLLPLLCGPPDTTQIHNTNIHHKYMT